MAYTNKCLLNRFNRAEKVLYQKYRKGFVRAVDVRYLCVRDKKNHAYFFCRIEPKTQTLRILFLFDRKINLTYLVHELTHLTLALHHMDGKEETIGVLCEKIFVRFVKLAIKNHKRQ